MAGDWVDLKDAIRSLREQLTEAIDEGKGKGMHFRVQPVELTLEVAVTTEGNGKLGWKIAEVGASRQAEATQTLKLTLTPVWKMQDGTVVDDPLISGSIPASADSGMAHRDQAAGQSDRPAGEGGLPDPDNE